MGQSKSEEARSKDTKGKGIATHLDHSSTSQLERDQQPEPIDPVPDGASFISRLSASAGKLANDMVLRHPGGTYPIDALPSTKAESSRSTRGEGVDEALTCRSSLARATFDDAFRSPQAPEQHVPGESDFSSFLNGTSMLEIAEPSNVGTRGYEPIDKPAPSQTPQTTAIVATDGMDVVALLDSGYDGVEDTAVFLTDTEQVALRHRLFEDGELGEYASQRGRWDDALNFFPSVGSSGNSMQEYADLLGTSDLEEAKLIWIDQWQGVLSNYTDEVWGELRSLVNVAREELITISKPHEEASLSQLRAVRRLQQILKHVRGT